MVRPLLYVTLAILVALASLWVATPVRADVDLAYYEVVQGSNPTEVIVRWSTDREIGTAGFRIRRGVTPDPTQAVDIHTAPARGSSISGYDYEYADTGLVPGRVYYYWLLELTSDGMMTELGVRQFPPPRAYFPFIARQ